MSDKKTSPLGLNHIADTAMCCTSSNGGTDFPRVHGRLYCSLCARQGSVNNRIPGFLTQNQQAPTKGGIHDTKMVCCLSSKSSEFHLWPEVPTNCPFVPCRESHNDEMCSVMAGLVTAERGTRYRVLGNEIASFCCSGRQSVTRMCDLVRDDGKFLEPCIALICSRHCYSLRPHNSQDGCCVVRVPPYPLHSLSVIPVSQSVKPKTMSTGE